MLRLFVVLNLPMSVTAQGAKLLSTASQRATSETEPEILFKVTFRAVCEARCFYVACALLFEHECMLAGRDLLFPSFDFRLSCRGEGLHYTLYERPDVRVVRQGRQLEP